MWDDDDPYDEGTIKDETERDDFKKHCKKSDFKYSIYHTTGVSYNFTHDIYSDNAVS